MVGRVGLRTRGDLNALVAPFDDFCYSLVRLEPHSLEDLRRAVGELAGALERHLDVGAGGPGTAATARRGTSRLEREHERFRASVEELRGLLQVVERDDHGGHRQALGQYGRILAEALRAHLEEERASLSPREPRGRSEPTRRPLGTP